MVSEIDKELDEIEKHLRHWALVNELALRTQDRAEIERLAELTDGIRAEVAARQQRVWALFWRHRGAPSLAMMQEAD
jgi:hypothetical protein